MVYQNRYIVALSHQLAHTIILLDCFAASCGEMPSFDYIITAGLESTARGGLPWKHVVDSRECNVSLWSRVLYQGQAKIEDELEITTHFSDVRRFSAISHISIVRTIDNAPIALGHTRWAWINRDTLKPRPFPPKVRAAVANLAGIDEAG